MDLKEQLKSLSAQDRKELLKQLQQEEKESKRNRRDAYEGLRAQFMLEVKNRLLPVVDDVKAFRDWVEKEAAAFRAVMREYGQLRKDEQASFTIVDGDMKLEVRSNKVKSFDERADLAAERLVDYLKRYAMGRELGTDDPMYQLGMTMIERNRQGDLDYKSVSKLYELEGKGRIFYLDQGGAPLSAKCPVCNGSGRVKVQSKVITRIEPFVPGEDDTELMTM